MTHGYVDVTKLLPHEGKSTVGQAEWNDEMRLAKTDNTHSLRRGGTGSELLTTNISGTVVSQLRYKPGACPKRQREGGGIALDERCGHADRQAFHRANGW